MTKIISRVILAFLVLFSSSVFAVNTDKFLLLTTQSKSLYTAMNDGTLVNPTWIRETPSGSGTAFVLSETPISDDCVSIYIDRLILKKTTDYTISGKNITLAVSLATGQDIYAVYQK